MPQFSRRRTILAGAAVGFGSLGTIAGVFGESEYTIRNLRVAQVGGPLSLKVELIGADVVVESPGVLRLTVENTAQTSVELFNTGVMPFGVLRAKHVNRQNMFRLYSPLYEKSEYIDATGGSFEVSLDELSRSVAPSESISAEYKLLGDRIAREGTYELEARRALLIYSRPEENSITEETPTVEFDITPRGTFTL
jgi:hypothetical protein